MLFYSVNAYSLSLTDAQYNNIGLIVDKLRETYPNLRFRGSRGDVKVIGAPEATVQQLIDGYDIDQLKRTNPQRLRMKQVRDKLKALGFNNQDLKVMGLANDIPD